MSADSAPSEEKAGVDAAAARAEREKKNRKNLGTVGQIHFVAGMAALTLWGAADAWAASSGWALARAAAVVDAVIAATVLTGILHEWGHYLGARLAGGVTDVLDKPAGYFFMFNFPFDENDDRAFLWMSWGGILVPWALVALTLALVPMDAAGRAMLLAVFVTRAVQVSLFEVPVAMRTRGGGTPQKELERQLLSGFEKSRYASIAIGALVFLIA